MLDSLNAHFAVGGFVSCAQWHALLNGSTAQKLDYSILIGSCDVNETQIHSCTSPIGLSENAVLYIVHSHRSPSWLSVRPRHLGVDRHQENPLWYHGNPSTQTL